jgi:DNA-binding IclR family transcriptional regulator
MTPDRTAGRSAAPAVTRAIQILDYLANTKAEAGVSEISAALGLNKSTCFNILKTLADESIVIKDPRFPVYRLGPRLVELGTASRRNFTNRQTVAQLVRPLVDELGITCLVAQPLPGDRGSIIVDRIIPRGRDVLTAPIGQVYPITAPALGRVLLANRDVEEVLAHVNELPDTSEAQLFKIMESLDAVHAKGYGWSEEEYQADVNAVATAVHNSSGDVVLLLCLIGYAEHFGHDRIDELGRQLRDVTATIEAALLRNEGVAAAL